MPKSVRGLYAASANVCSMATSGIHWQQYHSWIVNQLGQLSKARTSTGVAPLCFSSATQTDCLKVRCAEFCGSLVLGKLVVMMVLPSNLGGLHVFCSRNLLSLLGYGTAFWVRFGVIWIQWQDYDRNHQRLYCSSWQADATCKNCLCWLVGRRNKVIGNEDLVYTTETDLQNREAEWSAWKLMPKWQQWLSDF